MGSLYRAGFALCLLTLTGCFARPGAYGYGAASTTTSGSTATATPFGISAEQQERMRHITDESDRRIDAAENDRLDRLEKDALLAIKLTLGQQALNDSRPLPLPAAQAITALRKQKVRLRVEPVVDGLGRANDDFLQLKDSATDRLQLVARKSSEGTATAAERREMSGYSKISFKLIDLRMQFMKTSLAAMQANSNVQTSSLATMMRVATMVRMRKLYSMDLSQSDLDTVKRGLERQRHAEALAATTMAMVATYQAVINDGGDAHALDILADGAQKAFPIHVAVTDDEAKAYVDGLSDNVQKVKERYEAGLRKTWGDARYESQFKAGVDAMFASAEQASSQKSIADQVADARAAAYARQGATPPAATTMATTNAGGSASLPSISASTPGMPAKAKQAMNVVDAASAASRGDIGGAIDAAAKVFPGDTTIGASLQGLAALKNGDPKGAINAALHFVPVPGLKGAFAVASKLLFKDG